MIGIAATQADFHRLLRRLPGLRGHVDSWCADGDLVFIEFRLQVLIGGDRTEWPNVNPLAILTTLLRHPSVWWRSRASAF
jgi:hypothetical protein